MKTSILLFFLSFPVYAWDQYDTYRESAWHFVHFLDWRQTIQISDSCHHGGQYYETNPTLGHCPTRGEVDRFFIAGSLIHLGISAVLPPKLREPWQYFSIGYDVNNVVRNYRLGIKFNF